MVKSVPVYTAGLYDGYSAAQARKKALELTQVAGVTGQIKLLSQHLEALVFVMDWKEAA